MMTKERVEALLAKATEPPWAAEDRTSDYPAVEVTFQGNALESEMAANAELCSLVPRIAATCLALYEREDWQEMDSAPRDGSEFFAWCMERPAWSTAPRHFADIARWSGKTPHDHIGHFSARSGAIVTRWKPINPPI